MSALQWALLVLGAVAVIAIYVTSRRGDRLPKHWTPPGASGGRAPKLPGQDQMDMFDASKSAPKGEFDEFGVGKPRPRTEPGLGKTRSEEHTSELQSLMRISYAVFCLKKKKKTKEDTSRKTQTH